MAACAAVPVSGASVKVLGVRDLYSKTVAVSSYMASGGSLPTRAISKRSPPRKRQLLSVPFSSRERAAVEKRVPRQTEFTAKDLAAVSGVLGHSDLWQKEATRRWP
jgi:hypothetical protein